jgi:hypothetical protein
VYRHLLQKMWVLSDIILDSAYWTLCWLFYPHYSFFVSIVAVWNNYMYFRIHPF